MTVGNTQILFDRCEYGSIFRCNIISTTSPRWIVTVIAINLYVLLHLWNIFQIYKVRKQYPIRGRAPLLTIFQSLSFLLIFYLPFLLEFIYTIMADSLPLEKHDVNRKIRIHKIPLLNELILAIWWPLRRNIIIFFAIKIVWIINKPQLIKELKDDSVLSKMEKLKKYLLEREYMIVYIQLFILLLEGVFVFLYPRYFPTGWVATFFPECISSSFVLVDNLVVIYLNFMECIIVFY